ncbi:MAG: NUDIX domain-containing protein, partial [Candidatus Aenigmarchaeota archaeon]|nr:NUDIX domain-containing protein [Candidatus Aenigmarchaeota archaeon]
LIDENGNELGIKKERSEVHRDGDWHKGIHVWIIVGNKILLQKRALEKDTFPDVLDVSCAGHVETGYNYNETAVRELKEELGIQVSAKELIFLERRKFETNDIPIKIINREFINIYILDFKGNTEDIILQKEEVSGIRLFEIEELKNLLKSKPDLFSPAVHLSTDILDKLEKYIKKKNN